MDTKKTDTRFTIRFNSSDPIQLQAAALLNKQGYRSKAKHIAIALLHYENCEAIVDMPQTAQVDEKFIESVVQRVLRDREKDSPGKSVTSDTAGSADDIPEYAKEINFDEAMEALGENGLDAVLGSLDMFRNK